MFKREEMHLYTTICSAISSGIAFIWLIFALAHLQRGWHVAIAILLLISWVTTIIFGCSAYKVTLNKYKKQNLFAILIAPLFIPIFTSWDLYKKSGKPQKVVKEAIIEWEIRHIFDYLDHYYKQTTMKFTEEFIQEIARTRSLYKDNIIDKKSMKAYIRQILFEELKVDNLPEIYTKEQIKNLIPE